MLPDKRQRLARAFAVATDSVRPLHIERHVSGPAHALALDVQHLLVTENEPVLLPKLCLAETFPEVDADRAASRREVGKDEVIAYHDRRYDDDGPSECGRGQLQSQRPCLSNKQKQRDGPTDAKIQRVHTQPARDSECSSGSQRE